MSSPIDELIQSIPAYVLIGLGVLVIAIFLMWIFLPFAIYGIKKNQREHLEVLQSINVQLKQTAYYLAQANVKALNLDTWPDSESVDTAPETDSKVKLDR